MATKQQLENALINADRAGDVEAAKALANALKQGQYDRDAPAAEPVTPRNYPDYYENLTQQDIDEIEQRVPYRARGQGGIANQRRRLADLYRLKKQNPQQAQLIESMSALEAGAIGAGKKTTDILRGISRTARTATSLQKQLRNYVDELKQDNPTMGTVLENLVAPAEQITGSIVPGMNAMNALDTILQTTPFYELESEADKAAYQQLAKIRPATQVGEVVAEVVPALASGGVASMGRTLGGRIAGQSAAGATELGVMEAGAGGDVTDIAGAAALGGVLGGLAEPVAAGVRRTFQWARGKPASLLLKPNGQPTPDFQRALDENGVSFDDFKQAVPDLNLEQRPRQVVDVPAGSQADDMAAEFDLEKAVSTVSETPVNRMDVAGNKRRLEAFQRLGLTPTEAQRTRSATLFKQQQDLYKEGDTEVRGAIEAQDEALYRRLGEETEKARSGAQVRDNPIDVVVGRTQKADQAIMEAYEEAVAKAPKEPTVITDNLDKMIKQFQGENEFSGGVVRAIKERMKQMGILDKRGDIAKTRRSDPFLLSGSPYEKNRITVVQAEKLRQYMNDLYADSQGRGRHLITEMKKSLDDDVINAVGKDIFKDAREQFFALEKGLKKARLNKWDRNKVSLVRDILENKVAPEDLFKQVTGARSRYKVSDLKDLKRYLMEGDNADAINGLNAWNNLRADAMDHIRNLAFRGPQTQSGVQQISRVNVEKALRSIGNDKLKVLFNADELKFLRDLAEVSAYREPVPGTALGSGPSGEAIRQLGKQVEGMSGMARSQFGFLGGATFDILRGVLKNLQETGATQRQRRKILNLVDDAKKLEAIARKQQQQAFNRSRIGRAAGSIGQATALQTPEIAEIPGEIADYNEPVND